MDKGWILANRVTEIVQGFSDCDEDENLRENTTAIVTDKAAHVNPIRSGLALKEAKQHKSSRHKHQSIFEILNRNFAELGDGGCREIGYKDLKLCFVSFVVVFGIRSSNDGDQNDDIKLENSEKVDQVIETELQKVPLPVAYALWNKVLEQSHSIGGKRLSHAHLSYIRSTLVLLGMLDLATLNKYRDDEAAKTQKVYSRNGHSSMFDFDRSIECLVVHDSIHNQYGEYLAYYKHGIYSSKIEQWNEAVMKESQLIGSNHYTLRMLPLNTMRANHIEETFQLLNDLTFVRRRIHVLGASGAAKSHVDDIHELLILIDKVGVVAGPIDEREAVLGAYRQMLKYCIHEVKEIMKCNEDDNGNVRLGKAAMYKTADFGNALHLLGVSLGRYGFFEEEMEYYKEALRLKTLAVNGDIESSVSVSDTLHSMGFSLDNAGENKKALVCYNQALKIRYKCLDDDDLRIAETQHNKGALLCEEDMAEKAMECLEEALRIREIHYGEEHESCADTMQWIGNLLRKYGNSSDALDYFKFALSIKQKRLSSNDIDVANTLFNTAVLLDDIEKYGLSLVAYKEALRIRKLVLGEINQEVADTLFCMGNVASVLECHFEALGYYNESIEIQEALLLQADDSLSKDLDDTPLFVTCTTLPFPVALLHFECLNQSLEVSLPLTKFIMGTNHPYVCDILTKMGGVYMKLHDWDNAIGSFQGALRVKRSIVEDDFEVASLLHKKGAAYLYKKDYVRAKTTFGLAMQITRKISGTKSILAASHVYYLGVVYYYLNDFASAKCLFQQCTRIHVELAKKNNASLLFGSLTWIGRVYEKINEPQKALERYLYALQVYKKKKKKNSATTDYKFVATLLNAMGKVYEHAEFNLPEMSLKCYTEESNLIHSKFDFEANTNELLANSHFDCGMLYKKRGETDKSIEHLEKALELTNRYNCEKNMWIATILDNLGKLYTSKTEFSVSKIHYSSAYNVYENTIGRDDWITSDCAFRLGKVLDELQSTLALDFFHESMRAHRLNITEEDERVSETLFCCGRYHWKSETHNLAIECFERALGIRKRLLGDCSDVADTSYYLGKTHQEIFQDEKALIFYCDAVRIKKKVSHDESLYKVLMETAQCAKSCSHFQLALDCYHECLQAKKSTYKEADTAHILQQMGLIQMNHLENYVGAVKLLLDALQVRRSAKGEESRVNERIADLLLLVAEAYTLAEEYEKSLDFYDQHIQLLEESGNQKVLADSFYAMGNIFLSVDKPDYDSAIEKLTFCLAIRKEMFGLEDEQVANVLCKLGSVYEKSGPKYYDKAVEFLTEALRAFKTKRNKSGAVKAYHILGRLKATKIDSATDRKAAIDCYEEALKIRRQIVSLDDFELALILHEYADLLCMNNEYITALPFFEESLRIQKLNNGLKDEHVAKTLLRIAEVYVQLGNYDSSLVPIQQILLIGRSLGYTVHLGSCHYLRGQTYFARREFKEAIGSYLECLGTKQKEFGRDSLECATVYNDLGEAYGKIEDYDNALEALVQALKVRKTELGNNAVDYGHSVFSLAKIHSMMQKCDRALACLNEAERVYTIFKDGSDKLVEVVELKGDILYQKEDYDTAAYAFEKCIELLVSGESGEEDISCRRLQYLNTERAAKVTYKLGRAFAKLGDYEKAFDSYCKAIKIFGFELGKDNLNVGQVMYDVGLLIIADKGEDANKNAVDCFNEIVRIYDIYGRKRDSKVADALIQKSSLLGDSFDYDQATSLLDEAIEIYKESIVDSAEIGKTLMLYGKLYDAQNKNDESTNAHLEALRIFQTSSEGGDMYVPLALSNIGNINARNIEYTHAAKKCELALRIRIKSCEQEKDVADSLCNIGNILNNLQKKEEAYQYYQQGLKLYINLLGNADTSVANSYKTLGVIDWNRKNIGRAFDLFQSALHEKNSVGMLASLYESIGDCYYKERKLGHALENFANCIRMFTTKMGDDCILLSAPYVCVGLIYQMENKYEKAIHFHSKSLHISQSHSGKGSKESASSNFQIAEVLLASHQYDECITRLENHLKFFCDRSLKNRVAARVCHRLGIAQSRLGEFELSITSLNYALNMRIKLFGKNNFRVAATMFDLGKVMENCGDPEEAISIYDQAISIYNQAPDGNFHAIAGAYARLGAIFGGQSNNNASLHSWKKALKIYSKHLGRESSAVGEILYHIGRVYDRQAIFDKSISCLSEATNLLRSKCKDNEMVGLALGCIGKYYAKTKQFAKAVEVSFEAVKLLKKFSEAVVTAEAIVDVGTILKGWGRTKYAMHFFIEAFQTYEEILGPNSVEVASSRYNIGHLQKQIGESKSALIYFTESLRVYHLIEGERSLNIANNLFQIGCIYNDLGEKGKSQEIFGKCLGIRASILGDEHLEVLAARRCFNAKRI